MRTITVPDELYDKIKAIAKEYLTQENYAPDTKC